MSVRRTEARNPLVGIAVASGDSSSHWPGIVQIWPDMSLIGAIPEHIQRQL